jgi:hypothetical protein
MHMFVLYLHILKYFKVPISTMSNTQAAVHTAALLSLQNELGTAIMLQQQHNTIFTASPATISRDNPSTGPSLITSPQRDTTQSQTEYKKP